MLCFSQWVVPAGDGTKTPKNSVHASSDTRVRKRVSLQPLPDEKAENRNSAHPLPVGETDKDLVPEPSHEVEKRQQTAQHQKRAPEKRSERHDDSRQEAVEIAEQPSGAETELGVEPTGTAADGAERQPGRDASAQHASRAAPAPSSVAGSHDDGNAPSDEHVSQSDGARTAADAVGPVGDALKLWSRPSSTVTHQDVGLWAHRVITASHVR